MENDPWRWARSIWRCGIWLGSLPNDRSARCSPTATGRASLIHGFTSTPPTTGENLFSCVDSRNLIRYGGLSAERDYPQMDPAISYGPVEYVRILEILREHGWSVQRCLPHGGHQMALHIAAGFDLHDSEWYPGVLRPFGGFADGIPVVNGRVELPDAPGIGIECKRELHQIFQAL